MNIIYLNSILREKQKAPFPSWWRAKWKKGGARKRKNRNKKKKKTSFCSFEGLSNCVLFVSGASKPLSSFMSTFVDDDIQRTPEEERFVQVFFIPLCLCFIPILHSFSGYSTTAHPSRSSNGLLSRQFGYLSYPMLLVHPTMHLSCPFSSSFFRFPLLSLSLFQRPAAFVVSSLWRILKRTKSWWEFLRSAWWPLWMRRGILLSAPFSRLGSTWLDLTWFVSFFFSFFFFCDVLLVHSMCGLMFRVLLCSSCMSGTRGRRASTSLTFPSCLIQKQRLTGQTTNWNGWKTSLINEESDPRERPWRPTTTWCSADSRRNSQTSSRRKTFASTTSCSASGPSVPG